MAIYPLVKRGRYVELPIIGSKVRRVRFSGFTELEFDDPDDTVLTFWLPFSCNRWGYSRTIDPRDGKTLAELTGLLHTEVSEAKSDSAGLVTLEFSDGTQIQIEPADFESFELKNRRVHVVGAVGRLAVFEQP
jgi:hypothetical protein